MNINENLINERLNKNKENNCNENTFENDPEDNTEDKCTTSNNSIINSLDKRQERIISYLKQAIKGFETSKDGSGKQSLSQRHETNEFSAKLKINIDLGDKLKVLSK